MIFELAGGYLGKLLRESMSRLIREGSTGKNRKVWEFSLDLDLLVYVRSTFLLSV